MEMQEQQVKRHFCDDTEKKMVMGVGHMHIHTSHGLQRHGALVTCMFDIYINY